MLREWLDEAVFEDPEGNLTRGQALRAQAEGVAFVCVVGGIIIGVSHYRHRRRMRKFAEEAEKELNGN